MPDRRRHRGAHPRDAEAFAPAAHDALVSGVRDLSWLRSRGYPDRASVKLVGDRYRLRLRQRSALQRCAVSDQALAGRRAREVGPGAVRAATLLVDGYNVLLTVESALASGVVLKARDGVYRDLAALSRHFRRVDETRPALELLGEYLRAIGCRRAVWYLDRPISNSGRLKATIDALATEHGWGWRVELVASPDRILAAADEVVATADGGILDQGPRWLNLARRVIDRSVPDAWIVDLSR